MTYQAPVKDILFVVNELAGLDNVAKLSGSEDATADTAQVVLEESACFTGEVVVPLNVEDDRNPSSWKDGIVTVTAGSKEAFTQFGQGGWRGVQHPLEYGGQGPPKLIATACIEMLNTVNLPFILCPLLTGSAIEALLATGTEEQKQLFVLKLISGEWTGTMSLTEPQVGSDLAFVRTRAEPADDDTFKISDTKIFIIWGEHDMAENIVHLVLARTPGAPEGVKGTSLLVVPKFMVNPSGSLGARSDAHCVSTEHKLGVKASPTAVLQLDDNGGAIGTLVGEENRGLEYMFIMMNTARYAVGIQGIGVSERAYQKAVVYVCDRVQSRPVGGSAAKTVSITHHPDAKRMLLTMRAMTEGARTLAYVTVTACNTDHHSADDATRKQNAALYEFLVPIVKGWSTEMSIDVTSLGVQVHGGMGLIEETGAAQFYRDVRILPIYEGTTAIQASDLIGRKTARSEGAVTLGIRAEIVKAGAALAAKGGARCDVMRAHLAVGREALESVV